MTIIKALTQPAPLSFAISLVSVVALVLLLVTHGTAHGDIPAPSGGVDRVESLDSIVQGVW